MTYNLSWDSVEPPGARNINLVGAIPTPLKNMSSKVGMMKFPMYGKIN